MFRRAHRVAALAAGLLAAGCASSPPPGTPQPPGPNRLTDAEVRSGWQLLFDGTTTSGWHNYGKPGTVEGWTAIDGALVGTQGSGDLMTNRQFDSFELELDWKLRTGGNSGIFYWAHEASEQVYQNAPEYQILDNVAFANGLTPLTAAGSLYALYPAPLDLVKPIGEWNHSRIVTKGSKVEHWLNGVKVVEADFDSKAMKAKVAASKFAEWPTFGKTRRGYIGLQDHGDTVWFRNIMIRER